MFFICYLLMNTLFPLENNQPEGLQYFPDFLTPAEENELISQISNTELHTFLFHGYEAKRRVASFGYDWNFDTRTLAKGKEIPSTLSPLLEKASKHLCLKKEEFVEVLFTEYPAGSVINWHRDAPPFDLIAGISLHSDCILSLRPSEKGRQNRKSVFSLPVRQRSLYVLQGPSRSEWEHRIAPVLKTRYSITLRTLRSQVNK
jgi:alkylated DNA repair dioxygenase AlkB